MLVTAVALLAPPALAAGQKGGSTDEAIAPSGPIVDRILWKGLNALSEEELTERIVTSARPRLDPRFWRPAPRLDEFTLQEDLDRIRAAYAEVGHFAAIVTVEVTEIGVSSRTDTRQHQRDQRDQRVRIEFDVREGPKTTLSEWILTIPDPPDSEPELLANERVALERSLRFTSGQIFGTRLYRERRQALLAQCAELGFAFAEIEGSAEVDAKSTTATVSWTLHTGPRVFVGSISILGLKRVSPEIVLRELTFAKGDVLRRSAVEASERRLIATGLFRSAVIGRATPGNRGTNEVRLSMDVEIGIEEAPPRSVRASIGYGTEDGPRGEASLTWRNFLGGARRLKLRGFGSLLDVGAEGSLGQPWLLGEAIRGDLSASAVRQDRPGYEAFVTGAAGFVTFSELRDRRITLSFGPGYELSEIIDFGPSGGANARGPRDSTIVNTFTTFRYDRVDDPVDPTSGVRFKLANELGGWPIGSDLDYHRWEVGLRGYVGSRVLVLAMRAAATSLDPIGGGREDVPLTRRLYSGGTSSVRGFGFQKIGPEDASNDPIGGLSRLEASTEIRWRVHDPISLVAFVDAGDVRSRPWTFRPGELRAAAGPGLRVDTPVGPLRLDVGFLLNPPRDTDIWRLHLSVGHAF